MQGTISTPVQVKPHPWRRWLNYLLQALWVVAAIYVAQLFILSIRPGYDELVKVCTETVCLAGQLTEQGLASLHRLGISRSAFAVLRMVFVFAIVIVYGTVSLLIFRAKRHDNLALYVALVLLLFGAFLTDYVDVLREVQPQFSDLIDIVPGLTLIAFSILCYVFPDGRFFPRWTVWAAWGWIAAPVILLIATFYDAFDVVAGPVGVVLLALLATCIISPIQRYRKLSSRTQRQQLKWVLFGLTQLLATLLVVVELLPLIFPVLDVTGTLPNLLSNIFQSISVILFPMTVGIALLRYRLWNVNMVINRTLVYVPLTSILTVIYTTSLALSQRLFTTATGEQPQAVAIFTTIVLTTTFSPIKNALQSYVDRNFKEAPEKLKELDALGEYVALVVQALDHKSLAQRMVETVIRAHNAKGAALYLRPTPEPHGPSQPVNNRPVQNQAVQPQPAVEQALFTGDEEDVMPVRVRPVPVGVKPGVKGMILAYATPDWAGTDGEVSILLAEDGIIYGRLLLGQPSDREEYTLDEIEDIRSATVPLVANMYKLMLIHDDFGYGDVGHDHVGNDHVGDDHLGHDDTQSDDFEPSDFARSQVHSGYIGPGHIAQSDIEQNNA